MRTIERTTLLRTTRDLTAAAVVAVGLWAAGLGEVSAAPFVLLAAASAGGARSCRRRSRAALGGSS